MSDGAMVWLTDNELELLQQWYQHVSVLQWGALPEDEKLRDKLEAVQEEVACRVRR